MKKLIKLPTWAPSGPCVKLQSACSGSPLAIAPEGGDLGPIWTSTPWAAVTK